MTVTDEVYEVVMDRLRQKDAYTRITHSYSAAGWCTEERLAEVMDTNVEANADFMRTGEAPVDWLARFVTLLGIKPDWIQ